MATIMVIRLAGLGAIILIIFGIGIIGCTEAVCKIENDLFKVKAFRSDLAAFDEFTLSVYAEPQGNERIPEGKLLEIEGPGDIDGEFVDRNLLVLKLSPAADFPIFRHHYLFRLPMKCIGPIVYEMSSPKEDPFVGDTTSFSMESAGKRLVSFDSTRFDKVIIIRVTDISQSIYTRSVLVAAVNAISGELINEDTLRLSVTWCGEDKTQEILVKLPTSREEDLEYIVRE